MASGITILSQPTDYVYLPAYNPNWIVASSTNYAAANFKYTLIIEDVLTGKIWTEQIEPNPDHLLVVDIGTYTEKYMVDYLPINVYGWKKCAGASRKIRYNIGETYGTPPSYAAGTDRNYIVWNAGLDLSAVLDYSASSYVYDASVPAIVYLTNLFTQKVFEDRSLFLYILIQEGNLADIPGITIYTVGPTGLALGTYQIDRPDFSTGLYTDQYVCIDIGPKGLANISPGDVTIISGSLPIVDSGVASYLIVDDTNNTPIKNIVIDCSPRFTVYTLHYLKSNGAYETLHCKLTSEESLTATQSTFKKNPWSRNTSTNVMELDPQLAFEKSQGVTIQNKLKLNTDWLSPEELILHAELFTSVDVKVDTGKNNRYVKVKVTNTGYTSRNNDKQRQLLIDLDYSHQNHRQRG